MNSYPNVLKKNSKDFLIISLVLAKISQFPSWKFKIIYYFSIKFKIYSIKFHVLIADLLCNFEENQPENKKSLTIMKSNIGSRKSSIKSESLNNSFQGSKGEEFIFS